MRAFTFIIVVASLLPPTAASEPCLLGTARITEYRSERNALTEVFIPMGHNGAQVRGQEYSCNGSWSSREIIVHASDGDHGAWFRWGEHSYPDGSRDCWMVVGTAWIVPDGPVPDTYDLPCVIGAPPNPGWGELLP